MKNYVANPNYSDATGSPFWSVVSTGEETLSADEAVSDVTQLAVGTVLDNGYYRAAQIEDITKLAVTETELSTTSGGQYYTLETIGLGVNDQGDSFVYVNNVAGIATGQTLAILEGLQSVAPPYSAGAMSTDSFISEWVTVKATGQIPTVSNTPNISGTLGTTASPYSAYVMGSAAYFGASGAIDPITSFMTVPASTTAFVLSPYNAATGGDPFYIAASADPQAQANLISSFLSDFTPYGLEVSSIVKGGSRTILYSPITPPSTFALGQNVTFTDNGYTATGPVGFQTAYGSGCSGWNAGKIQGINQFPLVVTTATGSTVVTLDPTTEDKTGLAVGMGISGAGIPAGATVTAVPSSTGTTFAISLAVTSGATGVTATISAGASGPYFIATTNPPAPTPAYELPASWNVTGVNTVNPTEISSFFGSGSSGSNTITFTDGDEILGTGLLGIGASISTTALPSGTLITNISGNTITVSNNFTSSVTNAEFGVESSGMAYAATLPTENVLVVNNNDNMYEFAYGVPYFSPYFQQGASSPPSPPTPQIGANHYGYDMYFPVALTNFLGTPLGTFTGVASISYGSTTTTTLSVNSSENFYVGQTITFGNYYNLSIQSIPSSTEIVVEGTSASTATYTPTNYTNGSSPNAIWNYDDNLTYGAVIDTLSGTSSGAGAVGFDNSHVTGFHDAGTYVMTYQNGPRYLGSSSVGDLELVVPTTIGSTVGGTLNQPITAGSTTFVVNVNPNTAPGSTFTFGSLNQYQNYSFGGFVPLINPGFTTNFSGNVTSGSTVITNISPQYAYGLKIGQTVNIGSTTPFPSGTEIVALGKGTATVSNAASTSVPGATLSATSGAIYTVVIGQGSNQELVSVIPPSNTLNALGPAESNNGNFWSPGQSLDGSGNYNTPAIWTLANGQSFQYDHPVNDVVATPNFVYSTGGSTVAHAQFSPVLGDPDLATVYTISGGTDYSQTNALLATNPTNQLIINARANFNIDNPWLDSGIGGYPNISTTLAQDAVAGSTVITVADNAGFPTSPPTVFQSGIGYLPPTLGTLVGAHASGATALKFVASGPLPQTSNFFVTLANGTSSEIQQVATTSYDSATNVATLVFQTGSSTALAYGDLTPIILTQIPTDTQYHTISVPSFYLTGTLAATVGNTSGISTTPLPVAIPFGTQLYVNYNYYSDSFYVGASANAGATGVSIGSAVGQWTASSTAPPTQITLSSSYGNFQVGATVFGSAGIPTGTTITGISGSVITLSTAVTGSTTTAMTLLQEYQPHVTFPACVAGNGVFSNYGTTVTVGLENAIEPGQQLFFNCGGMAASGANPSFSLTAKSYAPVNSGHIEVLPFRSPYPFDATGAGISFTGSISNGATAITSVSSTAGLAIGQQVFSGAQIQGALVQGSSICTLSTGTPAIFAGEIITDTLGYIPTGTTVVSVTTGSTTSTVTMSSTATVSATEILTFGGGSLSPLAPVYITGITGSTVMLSGFSVSSSTTTVADTFSIYPTQFVAPPPVTLDANDLQETVYPIATPTPNAINSTFWDVQLANQLEDDHNFGAEIYYYQYPSNFQINDVTYRPDLDAFVQWDGTQWRTARVNWVQLLLSILGSFGGNDVTNVTLLDPSTGLQTAPDTFSNTLSTAFTAYFGGNRSKDPNGNEWTAEALNNILISLAVQVPQNQTVAFRSMGLVAQYKSEPLAQDIYISPSDNCVIKDGVSTSVNWTYSDLDNDQQTGWSVKIFSQATVFSGDFDPDSSTPVWSSSAYNASTSVGFDTSTGFVNGEQYYAYVKVSKTFHQTDWWGAWNYTTFVVTINAPQPPMLAVYADDENAVNTLTIMSTDNLLGPDNGSFTNSPGGWIIGSNDTSKSTLGVASDGTSLSTALTAGKTYTSVGVGAIGHIAAGSTIASSGGGTFKVSGSSSKLTDPLGFPVAGQFWVRIGGENLLVTNKVDGNNSGDTFVIKKRNYAVNGGPSSTISAHSAEAAVTYGLQEPMFVGSSLTLTFTEITKQKWTDNQRILVRTQPGSPSWSTTVTTGSYSVAGVGGSNQVKVYDPANTLGEGWNGRTVYLNYPDGASEPLTVEGVTTVIQDDRQSVTTVIGLTANEVSFDATQGTTTIRIVNVDNSGGNYNSHGACLPALPAGTVLDMSQSGSVGVSKRSTGDGKYLKNQAFSTVVLAEPYWDGDRVLVIQRLATPWMTRGDYAQFAVIPEGTRFSITLTTGEDGYTHDKLVTFSRPIGLGQFAGKSPVGGSLSLEITNYYAGTSAVSIYGTKSVTKVGGPGHTTVVDHTQSIATDFVAGSTSFQTTATIGSWSGSTFTPMSSTVASVTQVTAGWTGSTTTIPVSSTSGLTVGQLFTGYGVQPGTYITSVGTGTVNISNAAGTSGATYTGVPLLAYPTFSAVQLAAGSSTLVAGDNITGLGIQPSTAITAVHGSTSTGLILVLSSSGTVPFEGVSDTTPFLPNNPAGISGTSNPTIPVRVIAAANYRIAAGSTSVPTKPFLAKSSFPVGTPIRIKYPPLFSDNGLVVVPSTGSGSSGNVSEITLLSKQTTYTGAFTPTNSVPVIPNVVYGLSAFSRLITAPLGATTPPVLTAFIDFYDSKGRLVETATGATGAPVGASSTQWGSGWAPAVCIATAPTATGASAAAAYAVPRFQWSYTNANDTYAFSGVMFKALSAPAVDLNGNLATVVGQTGSSTQLLPLGSTLYPQGTSASGSSAGPLVANAISIPQSNTFSYASLGGYDTIYVFDPFNAVSTYEVQQGGSDVELFATLVQGATAGSSYLKLNRIKGIAVGTTLYVDYGHSTAENVVVDQYWDGTGTVKINTPLAYNHLYGARVYAVTVGLAATVTNTHPAGGTIAGVSVPGSSVAILNWNGDGFVNQPNDTYQYLVEKSVDGGKSWTTLRNGGNLHATSTGYATITDYEAVPGQQTLYRATADYVTKGGTTVYRGPRSLAITSPNAMTTSTWWIADSSNVAHRFPINVQNAYTEKQKHPSGVFYPLGSSRPFTISGVTQGRDGDIKIIWEDLANWQNFLNLINSGNILILTNPVESTRTYIFINEDVQITHHAAASPWREVEINYVEAAPPGYGFTYGSSLS